MALTMSRVDRIPRTYDLASLLGGVSSVPSGATGVSVALLRVGTKPTVATPWTSATYASGSFSVLWVGPDADATGGYVVPTSADAWMKITDAPLVEAVKIERLTVMGGGAPLEIPTGIPVVSVNGKTGSTIVVSPGDVGAQPVGMIAAAVSASGALVANKHNPVDATAAPRTMTLPTGQAEGTTISVEKTDSSVNLISITGSLRGVAAQTISLAWSRETITFRADSAGSWWPISGHKTKTSIEAAVTAAMGGRAATVVVAASNSKVPIFADYVCTGTDDQVTIQAAIDSLGASGGKVQLREGQFNCSAPVVLDRNYVDLQGASHTMWGGYSSGGYTASHPAGVEGPGGSKLKATVTGISLIEFRNTNIPSGGGTDTYRHRGIRVASLYLYGFSYTGTAIRTAYGADAHSGDDFVLLEDLAIQRFQHGIDVGFDSVHITGNTIQDCSGDGIRHAGNFGQIAHNLIYDIGGNGIVDSAFSTVITSNTIGDCIANGINSSGTSTIISANALRSIQVTAIATTGRSAAITGNTVDTSSGGLQGVTSTVSGISVAGTASTVQGNTLHAETTTTGYAIAVTGSASVVGNAIDGLWRSGSGTTISWTTGSVVGLNLGDNATPVAGTGPVSAPSGTVIAWYKADAITGVADTAAVTSWVDSSGTGRTLVPNTTSPVYAASSIGGKPAIRFDGTANALKNTTLPAQSQPFTVFIVAKQTASVASTRSILNANQPNTGTAAVFISATQAASLYAGTVVTGPVVTVTNPHVYEAVFNGASTVLSIDGSSTTVSPGSQGWNGGMVVGSKSAINGEFWNGDIAEVLVYGGAMSGTDRSAVRAYLGTKYGITVS